MKCIEIAKIMLCLGKTKWEIKYLSVTNLISFQIYLHFVCSLDCLLARQLKYIYVCQVYHQIYVFKGSILIASTAKITNSITSFGYI